MGVKRNPNGGVQLSQLMPCTVVPAFPRFPLPKLLQTFMGLVAVCVSLAKFLQVLDI